MPAESAEAMHSESGLEVVETKRAWLAIGAAWVLPGLGHVLLGRVRRGVLFGTLVLGAAALGLAHDGRLALFDTKQPFLTRLQVVANLGVGPLDLVSRMFVYGGLVYRMPDSVRGGTDHPHTKKFRERTKSGLSIYGTAYLWTAGLMNYLLMFDVWDITRGRKV